MTKNCGESTCYLAKCFSAMSLSPRQSLTLALSLMEGIRRDNVMEENQVNEEEGNAMNFEVVDDDLPREIQPAEDAALRDPPVTNLGTTDNPIELRDLPFNSFQFDQVLRNCAPLREED